MIGLIAAFVTGLIVMDTAWAWRTGTIQRLWRRLFPAPVIVQAGCDYCTHCHPAQEDEDGLV
jgi:hypothetical protein